MYNDSNEKVDFLNVEERVKDCWHFLTNDSMPKTANIKYEAFVHEVSSILACAIETAKREGKKVEESEPKPKPQQFYKPPKPPGDHMVA